MQALIEAFTKSQTSPSSHACFAANGLRVTYVAQALGTALGRLIGGAAFPVSGASSLGVVGAAALAVSFALLIAADR